LAGLPPRICQQTDRDNAALPNCHCPDSLQATGKMQRKIPQLDAVRGVAVLMVLMIHGSENHPQLHRLFRNGWMGVDLFFVLSGFLITGILLDTKQSEDYFKNFYARRCLRIWPLYYCTIFFMLVIVPFLRPSEAATLFQKSSPWWAYPLYIQNFMIPVPSMAAGALGVTWSLAIEEQFYLIWPWVVWNCSYVQLRRIAIVVFCLSPPLRLLLMHRVNIYSNTFCRLDSLMAGALLALLVRSENFNSSKFIKQAWILLLIAAPLALITEGMHARWIVFTLTALASAAFIYVAMFSTQKWLQLALTNRFLVYSGTISYGLYLLHKIPYDIAPRLHYLEKHPVLALPIVIAASYAAAILSFNFLEKPFLNLKRFFQSKPAVAGRA
jgi:peptidoglycan/LPS O-acetylase OafA/YrhL